MKIDYVISAPAQGLLPNHRLETLEYKDEFIAPVRQISDIIHHKVLSDCQHYDPIISLLFNAYTETCYLPSYRHFNNLFLDSVYADSGGLQIVTAGRTVTPEIKQEIYEAQAYSDYAMCFDSIALHGNKTTDQNGKVVKSRNERSNTGNKKFLTSQHREAGEQTGKNIKEQIEAFKRLNAKTKVIIIVQGNYKDDMIAYFNEIEKQLDDSDYSYIGGLAIADTCIGNGEMESIEMLRAAAFISNNCHPNVSSHLHVLGVGSIKRLRPIIYLKRSGYLEKFDHISYDSSSHTSCFTYGLLKLNGTCIALGKGEDYSNTEPGTGARKKVGSRSYFSDLYDMYAPVLSKYTNREKYFRIIFGDGRDNQWSYANIKLRAREANKNGDKDHYIAAHLTKACYTNLMIHNFCLNVNRMFEENSDPLLTVKNEPDMIDHLQQVCKTSKRISKRILREEEIISLDGFFE